MSGRSSSPDPVNLDPDSKQVDLEPYRDDIEKYLLHGLSVREEDEPESKLEKLLEQHPDLREYLDSIRDSLINPIMNRKCQVLRVDAHSEKFPQINNIVTEIIQKITNKQVRKRRPEIPDNIFTLREKHSESCENFKKSILALISSVEDFDKNLKSLISSIEKYEFMRAVRKIRANQIKFNDNALEALSLIDNYIDTDSIIEKNPQLKYLIILEVGNSPLIRKNISSNTSSKSKSESPSLFSPSRTQPRPSQQVADSFVICHRDVISSQPPAGSDLISRSSTPGPS